MITCANEEEITVWTIQPIEVWQQLVDKGVALVEPRLTPTGEVSPQYRWLVGSLTWHEHFDGTLPWWFYCSKPDLRKFRHYLSDEWHIRMELRLSKKRVVIFRIKDWNTVFSGRYLGSTTEVNIFRDALIDCDIDPDERPYPEPWQSRVEESWLSLFRFIDWGTLDKSHEGIVQELRLEDVVSITKVRGTDRF